MRWEAWPFISLEHVIGKPVLLGHLEVRLHVSRVHIFELRVGGTHPVTCVAHDVPIWPAPSIAHTPDEFRSHICTNATWAWFRLYLSGLPLVPTVPRSMGVSGIETLESTPVLAMSYCEAVGLTLLQELPLPFGGRHSP